VDWEGRKRLNRCKLYAFFRGAVSASGTSRTISGDSHPLYEGFDHAEMVFDFAERVESKNDNQSTSLRSKYQS